MTILEKQMIKVTVKRSEWLRGEGAEASRLLRGDGKMCCLGFVCLALGATKEQILNKDSPLQLQKNTRFRVTNLLERRELHCELHWVHHDAVCDAMELNDYEHTSDACKEGQLIPILAKVGIELEFVD